jgi:ribosomal protein S18 acetylase RimI-like enzyme
MATEAEFRALDNPIWHSLTTRHGRFGQGDGLARRFEPGIGPLAGMRVQSEEAYRALGDLLSPGEAAALFLESAPELPAGWRSVRHEPMDQMICGAAPEARDGGFRFQELGAGDVPEMLELTALTEPGPFRPRTYDLGGFLGIREDGRLAAMAGQRLALPAFTEVSAVCTHPDSRGRGYGLALVGAVARAITARGEKPILHVLPTNTGAIRVYEAAGFTRRRTLHLAVVIPPPRQL